MHGILPKLPIFHEQYGLNWATAEMSIICFFLMVGVFYLLTRKLSLKPSKAQLAVEFVVDAFDNLCAETLGKEKGRVYLPFIGTIFLFVFFSNMMGVIPFLEEPTRDSATPLGLMLVVISVVHLSAIKAKGFGGYLVEYCHPNFVFMPLNVVGEIAKGVSLAFRLFGNIFGGAVIIIVVSELTKHFFFPMLLYGFFGIFVGAIQAFVFAMLSLTYLAVAISEE